MKKRPMGGNSFDTKHDGVTFTVEFEIDSDGRVEWMGVYVGDSPEISDFLKEKFVRELETECYNHFPEPDFDNLEDR